MAHCANVQFKDYLTIDGVKHFVWSILIYTYPDGTVENKARLESGQVINLEGLTIS